MFHCIDPRTGEASVALSTSASLGSASQLYVRDRDRESDREDCESASQLGLAGSIVSGASRRLEVQAELVCSPSHNKRSSFASSETASATISLSERSATLSMADDGAASVASTRALAGSLLSYKVSRLCVVISAFHASDAARRTRPALNAFRSTALALCCCRASNLIPFFYLSATFPAFHGMTADRRQRFDA